jgi:rod shape-determining protein MreB
VILKFIRGLLTSGPYYLRVNRERVSVRNVSTGDVVEVTPKLGLDCSDTVLSVGDPVDPTAARVLLPFQHPRILIEDFAGAEKVVHFAIRKLFGKRYISPSPVVLVHPDLELEGGLTQIEARALREMTEGAGARRVYLHYGRRLTDQEVSDLSL